MNAQDRKALEELRTEIIKQGRTQERIDVRTENIETITEKQEQHLDKLNGTVSNNTLNIDRNDKRLKVVESHLNGGVKLNLSRKQVWTGGGSAITLLIMILYAIGKLNGWW